MNISFNTGHIHFAVSYLFAGTALYKALKKYKATEEELTENGFPMPSSFKGIAEIKFPDNRKKPISTKRELLELISSEFLHIYISCHVFLKLTIFYSKIKL